MAAVGAAVYFLNPRKTAEVKVEKVAVFAPHTVFNASPGVGHVIGIPAESEDDVYVVATLAITDKLRLPLFLDSTAATVVTSGGSTWRLPWSRPLIFRGWRRPSRRSRPLVSPPAAAPLRFEDSIAPGATRVGTVILLFPQIDEQAWKSKRSATLTIRMAHDAAPITVPLS